MTYAAHHENFVPYVGGEEPTNREAAAKRFGVLRRIFDAVMHSRRRHADQEIAAFLARSGGRLTDDLERELIRRITMSDWRMRD